MAVCPSAIEGIKISDYNVKLECIEEEKDNNDTDTTTTFCLRISYDSKLSSVSFLDEIVLSHKNRSLSLETIQAIYACFCPNAIANDFIKHEKQSNLFRFDFEAKEDSKNNIDLLTITRGYGLSRKKYTQSEAISKIKALNSHFSDTQISVQCLDAHHIIFPNWGLECSFTLKTGIYSFKTLLHKDGTKMTVRDYKRIKIVYNNKLNMFCQKFKVFRIFLDYIKEKKSSVTLWAKMGVTAGPMMNLYTILCEIDDDEDKIWLQLFDLCLCDVYQLDNGKEIIINSNVSSNNAELSLSNEITEQSIANFVALSIRYYCLERKENANEINKCDKYLLSIVLPYFDVADYRDVQSQKQEMSIKNGKSVSDKLKNIPLISGLFNKYAHFYKSWENVDEYEQNWRMKVDAETLKYKILKHLNAQKEPVNVIRNRWKYDENENKFKMYEQYKYDHVYTGKDEEGILDVIDTSYEYEWCMWVNKSLRRQYPLCKGYWKLLRKDNNPRIPIKHLNAVRTLLCKLNIPWTENKTYNVLLYENNDSEQHTAEYNVNIWHLSPKTSSMSIRIVKAFDPVIDGKKKIKSKDTHFLYFRGLAAEWAWYDNDGAKYMEYALGDDAVKQLEASYQGVQMDNFPLANYHRADKEDMRLFDSPQLTEVSDGMVKILRMGSKPFVLRFTFGHNKLLNMEQIALNNAGSQFPRNIRRIAYDEMKNNKNKFVSNVIDDGIDHRIFSFGNMYVSILNEQVFIKWEFEQNERMAIDRKYLFHAEIAMTDYYVYTDLVKEALELWRSNILFGQLNGGIKYNYSNGRNAIDPYIKSFGSNLPKNDFIELTEEKVPKMDVLKKEGLPINYAEIIKSKMLIQIDDKLWNELDELDVSNAHILNEAHTNGMMNASKKYSIEAINLYKQFHQKHFFKKRVFSIMSLQTIQSVCSVLKQQINSPKNEFESKPLIIAISNHQLLFDFKTENTQAKHTKFSKFISNIFDGSAFIKRIDSKLAIYDVEISDFVQNICNNGYLHSFLRLSSLTYKSTMFLFKRPNSTNIYIANNGYLRKLSLDVYDEDLHYFLPSFVTFQIGDFVDIECFSYPDHGTITKQYKSEKDGVLYYKIRSSMNVIYTLNYFQMTNRQMPNVYYSKSRKALINDDEMKKINLWNAKNTKMDASDPSHPMHMFTLATLESSKQCISAIQNGENKNVNIGDLQIKLKECGIIYLLVRTAKNAKYSEQIEELLAAQKEEIKQIIGDVDEEDLYDYKSALQSNKEKISAVSYINPMLLRDFENSESLHTDDSELNALLTSLEADKLITCKRKINQDLTYDALINLNSQILSHKNDKIYIVHINETRELFVEENETPKTEVLNEEKIQSPKDGDWDEGSDDDGDDWMTEAKESGDENEDDAVEEIETNKPKICIKSRFECKIAFECEMSKVNAHSSTKSIQDLMADQRKLVDPNKWSVDENRLLSFFYNNGLYNEYDLGDKNNVQKLRNLLSAHEDQPRFIKLLAKFNEFIKSMNDDENNYLHAQKLMNSNIVNGVETTKNGILLQQEYILQYHMERIKAKKEEQLRPVQNKKRDLLNTMVITYNPLQSAVITSNRSHDITHPIHIYASSYFADFYNDFSLNSLYNEWMKQPKMPSTVDKLYEKKQSERPKCNIIDMLSQLIRYNKKYEIVMVPSSVLLDAKWLQSKAVSQIACHIDAIELRRCTFMYNGRLYFYAVTKDDKEMEKAKKKKTQKIIVENEETKDEEAKDNKMEEETDEFFLDEIKTLIRKIKENIIEDAVDWMDPIDECSKKQRLRSLVKRNNKDIQLRWLQIGCGSCFLQSNMGKQTEIGPPGSQHYDKDFAELLKDALFVYFIDCAVPFVINKDIEDDNKCELCQKYAIRPSTISGCTRHRFCQKCIVLWQELMNNPEIGTMRENYDKLADDKGQDGVKVEVGNEETMVELGKIREIVLPLHCPGYAECYTELKSKDDIKEDKKTGEKTKSFVPMTVYQQLLKDNDSRYERLDSWNRYLQYREFEILRDYSEMKLEDLRKKYPHYDDILSGYG